MFPPTSSTWCVNTKGGGAELWQWAGRTPDVFAITSAAMGNCTVDYISSRAIKKLTKTITQAGLKAELQASHFFDHFEEETAFMKLFLFYYLWM